MKRSLHRLIGLPGDTLVMRDNRLIINGQPIEYNAISQASASSDWLERLDRPERYYLPRPDRFWQPIDG